MDLDWYPSPIVAPQRVQFDTTPSSPPGISRELVLPPLNSQLCGRRRERGRRWRNRGRRETILMVEFSLVERKPEVWRLAFKTVERSYPAFWKWEGSLETEVPFSHSTRRLGSSPLSSLVKWVRNQNGPKDSCWSSPLGKSKGIFIFYSFVYSIFIPLQVLNSCFLSSQIMGYNSIVPHYGKHWNQSVSHIIYVYMYIIPVDIPRTSLVAQTVKHLPTMQKTWVQSLGWEDPLEKDMATHSSTLAWESPLMEDPGRLQSMGLQRVRHRWTTSLSLSHIPIHRSLIAVDMVFRYVDIYLNILFVSVWWWSYFASGFSCFCRALKS